MKEVEVLILSFNILPQTDGRNFHQFDFDSHLHFFFFLNWLESLNYTSKAKCRANCGPRKESLKG